jgi:hypothetical protein
LHHSGADDVAGRNSIPPGYLHVGKTGMVPPLVMAGEGRPSTPALRRPGQARPSMSAAFEMR